MGPVFSAQASVPTQELAPTRVPWLPLQASSPWQELLPTALVFALQAPSPWQEILPTLPPRSRSQVEPCDFCVRRGVLLDWECRTDKSVLLKTALLPSSCSR